MAEDIDMNRVWSRIFTFLEYLICTTYSGSYELGRQLSGSSVSRSNTAACKVELTSDLLDALITDTLA